MTPLNSRVDFLLQHIDATQRGIEVAPYFNPALPKAAGKNVLILDVFDTEALRAFALDDPHIPNDRISEIEPVDLVGDAGSIADMVAEKGLTGQLAYIVSSHNFEHLSNPIRFLQGCHAALKPGGVLSMAVPDARACFDIFRMPTRLIDWISAFHNDRRQPSAETLFDAACNRALYSADGKSEPGVAIGAADPQDFQPTGSLRTSYAGYLERIKTPTEYQDAHCTVMIPETLTLMLQDLKHLGLIDFDIIEISATRGHEFFIHLRKPLAPNPQQDEAGYLVQRAEQLRKVNYQLGAFGYLNTKQEPKTRFKAAFIALLGPDLYTKLRAANRARKARNRAPR